MNVAKFAQGLHSVAENVTFWEPTSENCSYSCAQFSEPFEDRCIAWHTRLAMYKTRQLSCATKLWEGLNFLPIALCASDSNC